MIWVQHSSPSSLGRRGEALKPLSFRKLVDQDLLTSMMLGSTDNLISKQSVLGMEFSGTVLETGTDVSTVKEVNVLKSRELM